MFLTLTLKAIASRFDNKLMYRLNFLQGITSVFEFTETRLRIPDAAVGKSMIFGKP